MKGTTLALRWRRREGWLWAIVIGSLVAWAFAGLPIDWRDVAGKVSGAGAILRPMVMGVWDSIFFGRNTVYWLTVWRGVVESLSMAVLGTAVAAFLALPASFLAARTMVGRRVAPALGKVALGAIRTFPELLLAIIFFRGVGPGPLAGILAMAVHSVGMLGKLGAETIENIQRQPLEALQACGAGRLQVIWYAVLPQVLPAFVSNALYRFEINIRAATILGLVGAGGIGTPLIFSIQSRAWDQVGMLLIGIVMVVSLIDLISSRLRSRLV